MRSSWFFSEPPDKLLDSTWHYATIASFLNFHLLLYTNHWIIQHYTVWATESVYKKLKINSEWGPRLCSESRYASESENHITVSLSQQQWMFSMSRAYSMHGVEWKMQLLAGSLKERDHLVGLRLITLTLIFVSDNIWIEYLQNM
jgi:hypothetical protein